MSTIKSFACVDGWHERMSGRPAHKAVAMEDAKANVQCYTQVSLHTGSCSLALVTNNSGKSVKETQGRSIIISPGLKSQLETVDLLHSPQCKSLKYFIYFENTHTSQLTFTIRVKKQRSNKTTPTPTHPFSHVIDLIYNRSHYIYIRIYP